jgi:hypothetical protein
MPRLKKVPCAQCDAKIVPGVSFCTNCEQPTSWASQEERATWELRQWSQKRTSRPKRGVAQEGADVTPIRSRRTPAPSKPVVRHPSVPERAMPTPVAAPGQVRPVRATKPVPERVTASAATAKKQVARSKPEPAPERAPAQPRKAARGPISSKKPAVQPAPADQPAAAVRPEYIDLDAAPAMPDHAAEQTELLRELLQHVISIEEKMSGNRAGLSRRLRLLKR